MKLDPPFLDLKFATARCGRVAYHLSDVEEAPTVLLLHGNSSNHQIFRHQLSTLRTIGCRALLIDLPGHGFSDDAIDPQTTYSFAGYAQIVSQLLDQLSIESVHVIGWSLGGHIGLELLAAETTRVKSLLIVGTPPIELTRDCAELAFTSSQEMALAGKKHFSTEDSYEYCRNMLGADELASGGMLDTVKRTDGNARYYMMENALLGKGIDQKEVVSRAPQPICVVHGERDPFVKLQFLNSIVFNNLWSGQVHVLHDLGHAPHFERSDTFNAVMSEFLIDMTQ